jgi:hypothetical protein
VPLPSAIVATAVREALLLLAYQVLLGGTRDILRALCWVVISALAGLHISIFCGEAFLWPFWYTCALLIYLHYLFRCLTLAAYVILLCHYIWVNLA